MDGGENQFRGYLNRLDLTVSEFARFSGFDKRTVAAWYRGREIPVAIRRIVLDTLSRADRVQRSQPEEVRDEVVQSEIESAQLTRKRSARTGRLVEPAPFEKQIARTRGFVGPGFGRRIRKSLEEANRS